MVRHRRAYTSETASLQRAHSPGRLRGIVRADAARHRSTLLCVCSYARKMLRRRASKSHTLLGDVAPSTMRCASAKAAEPARRRRGRCSPETGRRGAMQDLLAGQIDLGFDGLAQLPLLRAGNIKAYGVTTDTRF